MIVVRVLLNVKPESRDQLLAVMHDDAVETRKFAGCLRFQLYTHPLNTAELMLYEEWESAAAFEAYRQSDYLKERGGQIFPLLDGKPDAAYYDAVIHNAS